MPLTWRLSALLATLLLLQGALLAVVGARLAGGLEAQTQQRLARGLAAHIVARWPELAPAPGPADAPASHGAESPSGGAERAALLRMLASVNPAVQVYLLGADGRVLHYIGEPGMVRNPVVSLSVVRRFLAGEALPLFGTDPMEPAGAAPGRLFSAAAFPSPPGAEQPGGFLYIVLDSPARARLVAEDAPQRIGLGLAAVAGAALAVVLVVGVVTVRRMTQPLRHLAGRLLSFDLPAATPGPNGATSGAPADPAEPAPDAAPRGDEVRQLAAAFDAMALRLAEQAHAASVEADAHREEIAGLAHDLRTPLTALHGHLEALAAATDDATRRSRLLTAALQQSDKMRHLSQQLFELAALRALSTPVARERIRLDELVSDTVQKFEFGRAAVALAGPAPGVVEVEGDLQLIDRALTNLIDNAVRHAAAHGPVRVRLHREGAQAQVVVEDQGPGLPAEVRHRLASSPPAQRPRAEPSMRRGTLGGLGLSIVQRIAELHGGRLEPLPSPGGGTRLALRLPLS